MKKTLSLITLFAVLAAALTGCSGSADSNEPAPAFGSKAGGRVSGNGGGGSAPPANAPPKGNSAAFQGG